jgi:hypothetical protein
MEVLSMTRAEKDAIILRNVNPFAVQSQTKRSLVDDNELIVPLNARSEYSAWRIKNVSDDDWAVLEVHVQFVGMSRRDSHRFRPLLQAHFFFSTEY